MRRVIYILGFVICLCSITTTRGQSEVKTTFQSSQEWRPTLDNRADAVMVYGVNGNTSDVAQKKTFENRVASWRERGYITHFMTGIAWGNYQEYFTGKWDGEAHLDEGQVMITGDTIWHGHLVPYIVPSDNYIEYIKQQHIRRVVDAGITDIFMEEPEFWARAGYSESFKREWQDYYGFAWRAQDQSAENTYLSNKLKYYLYYNAIDEICSYAKSYGRSKGLEVRCYIPTHSLINYSQWQIVSPEASLSSLPCIDGYIAQVWTGTSREPNYFDGQLKERVFETAYLEYGSMESMTAPTGRKMFFLTDPIEDWPRDWVDYKRNYQATFIAQLLYPNIANYEVMPWPERIYEGLYRSSANSETMIRIPRDYSTQMQVMINALNYMPVSRNKVSGTDGLSILLSNSLMFQRFPVHDDYDDPQLSNFYGLALPLLKRGVPVKTVHIENVEFEQTLKDTKVLIMSYTNMKPMDPAAHRHIADWVRAGGALIYCSRDNDPFQSVMEWWNQDGNSYDAPSDHLFEMMGLEASAKQGSYKYGVGTIAIVRNDPKEFILHKDGDAQFIATVCSVYEKCEVGQAIEFKNNFYLQRGVFDIISVLDQSVSSDSYIAKGTLVDLFDPELKVYRQKEIGVGEQALFVNIDRIDNRDQPQVIASASRIYDQQIGARSYSFTCKSPAETTNVIRVLLPRKPKKVEVDGVDYTNAGEWNRDSKTYFLSFENLPRGRYVEFKL